MVTPLLQQSLHTALKGLYLYNSGRLQSPATYCLTDRSNLVDKRSACEVD